jgi:hypothetical protein
VAHTRNQGSADELWENITGKGSEFCVCGMVGFDVDQGDINPLLKRRRQILSNSGPKHQL